VLKNVTLSADERLIEAARERARSERSTLNEQFRIWLRSYVGSEHTAANALRVVEDLRSRVRTGGHRYTREELNER